MANIKIKNKGNKEIFLTRYYNPTVSFDLFRDNVGFNDSNNSFSDYCFIPSCSTWQNDKIKILSLPDKGKLFYITNPGNPNPIYSDIYIGQIILVRDLIDNRVLKFNAEGYSDNQYTVNYLTQFNIERFCGDESNNIIATVKLNLIQTEAKLDHIPDIFITIYKADSGSHYIGQIKFYGLQASVLDGSKITKIELFCRFRAIGENIWWQKTETHIVNPPVPSINLNKQFVYAFKDSTKYIGTRDWNGADSAFSEVKIYTSAGEVKVYNINNISFPWYGDYPSSITL